MDTLVLARLVQLVFVIVFAGVVPTVAIAMLVRALIGHAPSVQNYRGNTVIFGLGIVWFLWALSLALLTMLFAFVPDFVSDPVLTLFAPAFPLVFAACVFGLIDDALGDSSSKGFSGHMKNLLKGRLTTGGLKVLGIGFTSLVCALYLERVQGGGVAFIVIATCVMALAANLMNLFDLRPGRTLKIYTLLYVIAVVVCVICRPLFRTPISVVELCVLGLAPVVAVWRFDLGEKAMLGDAGANAAGVLVGFLLCISLPVWGLAIALVLLLTFNLVSEKVSFTEVIADHALLTKLDMVGRAKEQGKKNTN